MLALKTRNLLAYLLELHYTVLFKNLHKRPLGIHLISIRWCRSAETSRSLRVYLGGTAIINFRLSLIERLVVKGTGSQSPGFWKKKLCIKFHEKKSFSWKLYENKNQIPISRRYLDHELWLCNTTWSRLHNWISKIKTPLPRWEF